MRKLSRIIPLAAIFAVLTTMPTIIHGGGEAAAAQGPAAVEKWFENLRYKKEKVTKLHFYLHDQLTGPNATAWPVAQSNITFTSSTGFGQTFMVDDLLTSVPKSSNSEEIVGRAQGLNALTDLREFSLFMNLNLLFTEGKYKDSTLNLCGRHPVFHKYREMSIVAGTGVFRLARGIATGQTYFVNTTTGDAIVEYHVIIVHY